MLGRRPRARARAAQPPIHTARCAEIGMPTELAKAREPNKPTVRGRSRSRPLPCRRSWGRSSRLLVADHMPPIKATCRPLTLIRWLVPVRRSRSICSLGTSARSPLSRALSSGPFSALAKGSGRSGPAVGGPPSWSARRARRRGAPLMRSARSSGGRPGRRGSGSGAMVSAAMRSPTLGRGSLKMTRTGPLSVSTRARAPRRRSTSPTTGARAPRAASAIWRWPLTRAAPSMPTARHKQSPASEARRGAARAVQQSIPRAPHSHSRGGTGLSAAALRAAPAMAQTAAKAMGGGAMGRAVLRAGSGGGRKSDMGTSARPPPQGPCRSAFAGRLLSKRLFRLKRTTPRRPVADGVGWAWGDLTVR